MKAPTSSSWTDITVPDFSIPWPSFDFLPDLPGEISHYVIGLPVIFAILIWALPAKALGRSAVLAVLGGVLTLIAALWQLLLVPTEGAMVAQTVGPLAFGDLEIALLLSTSNVFAITGLVVALIALVVQVFARWYLWFDPRYRQFAATVSLFTAAMLLVVNSGDAVLTLVGWEVMGWCSYLLIGHLSAKASACRAAAKALIVTRLADVGFVLGIVALAAGAQTTSWEGILQHWSRSPGTALTVAMVLMVIGVAGKSALFPFQDWLPDAMEGPTPASALIHAATMVAAGTVVLAQLLPLLQSSSVALWTLAIAASVTTLLAALLAFAQPDLKRLLAWSTVSQVAIMLAALTAIPVGEGADVALLHLTSHAIFKSLLFLAVGWLAVLTGGTVMVYIASGVRRYGSVRWPLGMGLLALAGVPPLVGFVSKELILVSAESGVAQTNGGPALLVLAAVGAGAPLTAAYCMRAWLILDRALDVPVVSAPRGQELIDDFFTEPEVVVEAIGVEEAESAISSSARAGVTTLGVLTVVGGLLPFSTWFEVELHLNIPLLVSTLGLMAAAALAVVAASRGVRTRDAAARLPAGLSLIAERGLGADTAYQTLVTRPTLRLARSVMWLDQHILDSYVRGAGIGARWLGQAGQDVSPTRPAKSLALLLGGVGLLVLLGWWWA